MLADPMHRLDPDLAGLRETFARQREGAVREPYPDAATRDRRLGALEQLLRGNAEAIAGAIARDFGHRSHHETRLLEIFPSLEAVKHARRHLRRWMRPERRSVSLWFQPGRARVFAQPLGVVGIVVPWNYPIYLAAGPLVAALAAGNRVMIKMSELVPATGALLATLVAESFARDEVCVVNGDADVGRAFAALPFDHLLFTGSTAVGRAVMRAAAENLTPVTLELGGKSPAIVAPGLSARRGRRADHGRQVMNAGQTCIAPDYALVPAARCRRLRRGGAPRRRDVLAGSDAFARLHGDRRRAPLRPADRVSRRGARAGRGGAYAQPGRGAGSVDATDPADDRARRSRRHAA